MILTAYNEAATVIRIMNTRDIMIPKSLKRMTSPPKSGEYIVRTRRIFHPMGDKSDLPSNNMGRRYPDNRLKKSIDAAEKPRIINITAKRKTVPRHNCSLRPISRKTAYR
jgi:hypothetical protein